MFSEDQEQVYEAIVVDRHNVLIRSQSGSDKSYRIVRSTIPSLVVMQVVVLLPSQIIKLSKSQTILNLLANKPIAKVQDLAPTWTQLFFANVIIFKEISLKDEKTLNKIFNVVETLRRIDLVIGNKRIIICADDDGPSNPKKLKAFCESYEFKTINI